MTKILDLDHINIKAPARLIDEVIHFYSSILGLSAVAHQPPHAAGYWLYAETRPLIHLGIATDRVVDSTKTGRLDHVAFNCTDLTEVKAQLDARNVRYSTIDLPEMRRTLLILTDPAGIKIELGFGQ